MTPNPLPLSARLSASWHRLSQRFASLYLSAAVAPLTAILRTRRATLLADVDTQPVLSAVAPRATHHSPLFAHTPRPHTAQNANERHKAQLAQSGLNQRIAVWTTKNVGTMQCAYLFAGIGIGSLIGVFTNNVILAAVCGSLSSYFLQLVLLPILSVGQNVLSAHQELQSEEQFKATVNTEHDVEQTIAHLNAQDSVLVSNTNELLKQTPMLQQALDLLRALSGDNSAATPAAGASDGQPDEPPSSGQPPSAPAPVPVPPRTRRAKKFA